MKLSRYVFTFVACTLFTGSVFAFVDVSDSFCIDPDDRVQRATARAYCDEWAEQNEYKIGILLPADLPPLGINASGQCVAPQESYICVAPGKPVIDDDVGSEGSGGAPGSSASGHSGGAGNGP